MAKLLSGILTRFLTLNFNLSYQQICNDGGAKGAFLWARLLQKWLFDHRSMAPEGQLLRIHLTSRWKDQALNWASSPWAAGIKPVEISRLRFLFRGKQTTVYTLNQSTNCTIALILRSVPTNSKDRSHFTERSNKPWFEYTTQLLIWKQKNCWRCRKETQHPSSEK